MITSWLCIPLNMHMLCCKISANPAHEFRLTLWPLSDKTPLGLCSQMAWWSAHLSDRMAGDKSYLATFSKLFIGRLSSGTFQFSYRQQWRYIRPMLVPFPRYHFPPEGHDMTLSSRSLFLSAPLALCDSLLSFCLFSLSFSLSLSVSLNE